MEIWYEAPCATTFKNFRIVDRRNCSAINYVVAPAIQMAKKLATGGDGNDVGGNPGLLLPQYALCESSECVEKEGGGESMEECYVG